MNTHIGPSSIGLQHMAARAQEARSLADRTDATPANRTRRPATAGHDAPATGKNLPAATAAREAGHEHEHLTDLDRAIERLQNAALKNPQAKGLQHALEMLQRNQDRHAVDTQA